MKFFQAIVDWSQKQPHWWCRQMAYLYGLSYIGNVMLAPSPHILMLLCFLVLVCSSSSAARCARVARHIFKLWLIFFWSWAAFALVVFMLFPDQMTAIFLLGDVSLAAYQSFCGCKPPAPPKHKFQFARGTA